VMDWCKGLVGFSFTHKWLCFKMTSNG
jgi:hypothetical protein